MTSVRPLPYRGGLPESMFIYYITSTSMAIIKGTRIRQLIQAVF